MNDKILEKIEEREETNFDNEIFDSTVETGKYLSLFYRKLMLMIGNDLKGINMTPLQSIVLINIKRNVGVNQNELANMASVDKASVSRVIRNLEVNDLLYKEIDDKDRRYFKLYLTDKGEKEVEKSIEIQKKTWMKCMQNMTLEERIVLKDAMKKLYNNLCEFF